MSWFPTTDFENEVVSLQPDHDFIYGQLNDAEEEIHYPRPESHLRFIQEKKKRKEQNEYNSSSNSRKLSIISKVQRIAGTKPLGEQPTLEDWDDDTHVERETIAMMRHLGLQPSIEQPLTEQQTIATLPLTEEMLVMHNGAKRMPIFYNDKFFKLKPRVSLEAPETPGSATDPNQSSTSHSTAEEVGHNVTTSASSDSKILFAKKDNFETADDISMEVKNEVDTAEDESYNTAYSMNYITSRSWYRSNNKSAGSTNTSTSSNQSSHVGSMNARRRHEPQIKQAERFYTAKELYFKHRNN